MDLISVHVPKTGGHAFCNLLVHHYGIERIVKDYENTDLRTITDQHRVVHGHFGVAKYHGLFPEARRIAWVRHPVSWVLSYYYYSKSVRHQAVCPVNCRLHEENLSLSAFAHHPLIRNICSRQYLYGLDLREFAFLGVQEHFREDVADFCRMMGWEPLDPGVDNANPQRDYHLLIARHLRDPGLRRELERLNEDDLTLYERAMELRSRRRRYRTGPSGSGLGGRLLRGLLASRATSRQTA